MKLQQKVFYLLMAGLLLASLTACSTESALPNTGGKAGGSDNPLPPAQNQAPTPPLTGPFVVQQIASVSDEALDGEVCSLNEPFKITVHSQPATFDFIFVPDSENHGQFTYAYTIDSVSESHEASGEYTLVQDSQAGLLLLRMNGTDLVNGVGFTKTLPMVYAFNLVPSTQTHCPVMPGIEG